MSGESYGAMLRRLWQAVFAAGMDGGPSHIATVLFSYADPRVGEAFPSVDDLAGRANVSDRTAQKHLQALESGGILWAIRRDRGTSEGRTLTTLVQRDREGALFVVPNGRTLYLVVPLASNAAREAWTLDGRAHGRRPAPVAAPKPVVKRAAKPVADITASVIEPLISSASTVERGAAMLAALRDAAKGSASLVGPPSMEAECAAMLARYDLTDHEISVMGALLATPEVWASKKGGDTTTKHPTLEFLATWREPGADAWEWRRLTRLISKARGKIAEDRANAERRAELEAGIRHQAEREAAKRKREEEARAANVERLRAKYPDLDWSSRLSTVRSVEAAEDRERREAALTAKARAAASERERAAELADLRARFPECWTDPRSNEHTALFKARALAAAEAADAREAAQRRAVSEVVPHAIDTAEEAVNDTWVSAAKKAGIAL